jgi:hypothetical protein
MGQLQELARTVEGRISFFPSGMVCLDRAKQRNVLLGYRQYLLQGRSPSLGS